MPELRSKKQELFVNLVVQGMKQRDAYRTAYHNNMTDAQVDCEASAMINGTGRYKKDPKIHQRYLELHEKAARELEEQSIAKSKEMQQVLTNIIRQQMEEEVVDYVTSSTIKKKASIKDIINAVNTLAKMQGVFDDNKQQDKASEQPTIIIDI